VILLPVIGTIVYWVMRKPTEEEILGSQAASEGLKDDWPGVKQRLPDDE
jgi:hypothetical protein